VTPPALYQNRVLLNQKISNEMSALLFDHFQPTINKVFLPHRKFVLAFVALFFLSTNLYSQTARNNYNALLEPDDLVLHGAGQSPDAFEDYYHLMPEDNKPLIYMYYISLNRLNEAFWVDHLQRELEKYPNHYIIPQIGLSMTGNGDPADHYEGDVAAGVYDEQIGNLIQGLKQLGRPAYLRIGYEFNGTAWNGYEPGPYVEAYQRITDAIRDNDLEVATVWCAAVGGGTDANYLSYYPGDDYVDWWGIDLFSDTHFSLQQTTDFMMDAETYGKPVMIGETTPRYIGADDASDWEDWFLLYFNFIENNPGVKATCYINWDWAEFPQWFDWGDARLDQNDFVRVNYVHRLRNELYGHASTQLDFRGKLNYDDTTAPSAVAISGSGPDELPITLSWNPVSDPNQVLYSIYKNDVFYANTYDTEFTDVNYAAGESLEYRVSAMDWAGNESSLSNSLSYELSDTIRKSLNPVFDEPIFPWSLDTYGGAQASYDFPNDELTIDIEQSTATNWHVQIVQNIELLEQNEYYIETTARSSTSGPAVVIIQRSSEPFDIPVFQPITLQTNDTDFSTLLYEASETDKMNVGIYLGELDSGDQVVIDHFSLFEINGRDGFVGNVAPVSEAGDDFTYTDPFSSLGFDGSGSFDSDGSIVTYLWEQLSGLEVLTIDSPNATTTTLSDVQTGDYVFRLTVTDNQGAITSDDILVSIETLPMQVNTEEPGLTSSVRLSPNPTSGWIGFQLNEWDGQHEVMIQIMDLQGRMVMTDSKVSGANEVYTLDVSGLNSGMYMIHVSAGSERYVGKFIVE
jgi:hypothetical protein